MFSFCPLNRDGIQGFREKKVIDGDYLYISGSWAGLTIVDISNPEDPVWDFNDNADGNLIVVDNYLYEGGVNVFDVSDKYNPRLVYSADLGFGFGAQPLAKTQV